MTHRYTEQALLERLKIGAAVLAAPALLLLAYSLGYGSGVLSFERLGSPLHIALALCFYPIFEEIVFRGLIQAELSKISWAKGQYAGLSLANVMASGLFACAHIAYFQNTLMALVFIPSLVFGHFFESQGRLHIPILLHAFYNLSGMLYPVI